MLQKLLNILQLLVINSWSWHEWYWPLGVRWLAHAPWQWLSQAFVERHQGAPQHWEALLTHCIWKLWASNYLLSEMSGTQLCNLSLAPHPLSSMLVHFSQGSTLSLQLVLLSSLHHPPLPPSPPLPSLPTFSTCRRCQRPCHHSLTFFCLSSRLWSLPLLKFLHICKETTRSNWSSLLSLNVQEDFKILILLVLWLLVLLQCVLPAGKCDRVGATLHQSRFWGDCRRQHDSIPDGRRPLHVEADKNQVQFGNLVFTCD